MRIQKDTSTPAFPVVLADDQTGYYSGLTKREYFAGLALPAIIGQNNSYSESDIKKVLNIKDEDWKDSEIQAYYLMVEVTKALNYTDVLLKELSK